MLHIDHICLRGTDWSCSCLWQSWRLDDAHRLAGSVTSDPFPRLRPNYNDLDMSTDKDIDRDISIASDIDILDKDVDINYVQRCVYTHLYIHIYIYICMDIGFKNCQYITLAYI